MTWTVPRIWDNEDVWIIGGGPSLTRQFGVPEKVVQQVVSGASPPSTYSPYMRYLHDKHVIGINVAFLIGTWVDIAFFGDVSILLKYKQQLASFPGLKVSCHPDTEKYEWIRTLGRDTKHAKGISPDPRKVSWNHNSGAAAISLAVNAGAGRVLLLGFDMKLGKGDAQHWHDMYHRMGSMDQRKKMMMPFDRHLRGFPAIAEDARKRGVEIVNVCPDSAIEEFRKCSMKEFL